MAQSSQHELYSMVQYCVEFWLESAHSCYVVICNVNKSDMFGQVVVHCKTGSANGNVAHSF